MPTQEIGGGIQIPDTTNLPNPIEQYTKVLNLQDLSNKINQAPYDLQKAQAEAALRQNDALNIDISNMKLKADTDTAVFDLYAKQRKLFTEQAMQLPDLIVRNPLAAAEVAKTMGGRLSLDPGGKTASVIFADENGIQKGYTLPLGQSSLPEGDQIKIDKERRDDWVNQGQKYQPVYSAF